MEQRVSETGRGEEEKMNLSQLRCCQCEEPLKEEEIALAQALSDERDLVTCERCEMLCDVQDLAHEASADAAHGALLAALTMEEADHEDSSVHRAALEAAQRAAREGICQEFRV